MSKLPVSTSSRFSQSPTRKSMSRPASAASSLAVSISTGERSMPVTFAPAIAAFRATAPVPVARSSQRSPGCAAMRLTTTSCASARVSVTRASGPFPHITLCFSFRASKAMVSPLCPREYDGLPARAEDEQPLPRVADRAVGAVAPLEEVDPRAVELLPPLVLERRRQGLQRAEVGEVELPERLAALAGVDGGARLERQVERVAEQLLDVLRPAPVERRAGALGERRLERGEHLEHRADPALGNPRRERELPAGPRHPRQLGRSPALIGREHDAEGRDDDVEARVLDLQALGVADPVVDLQPDRLRTRLRRLDQRRGEVDSRHPRARTRGALGDAGAAGDLEPAQPGRRPDGVDDRLVDIRDRLRDHLERRAPPGRALPLLQLLECHRDPPSGDPREWVTSDGIGTWTPAERYASGARRTRSSASTRSRAGGTWRGSRTRSASCSRTCSAPAATRTPRQSRAGWRPRSRAERSRSARAASSTRTSPACPRSSTSPRCGTRCRSLAATRRGSTR